MQRYSTRKKAFTPDVSREEFLIYSDNRFYSPVSEISWNFMKQLK